MPALPLALTSKVAVDVLTNLYLAKEEWKYNEALCGYCQSATVASLASLLLSLPEAREALQQLQRRARTGVANDQGPERLAANHAA